MKVFSPTSSLSHTFSSVFNFPNPKNHHKQHFQHELHIVSHTMEPSMNPKSPFSPLPPGCQFFPSEHQIISHYLTLKNNPNHHLQFNNLINEIDLYRFDPFDLPESARFVFGREGKRKHWYCFAAVPRVKRGRGEKRPAGGGFWRRSGSVKDIVGAGAQGVVLGTRKTFVFYLGDSVKTAVRTKWIMYEYALVDQKMAEASYVLCRVFAKSHHQCTTSNDIMKPFTENVKTVSHIGIQCDDKINSLAFEGDFLELNDLLSPL